MTPAIVAERAMPAERAEPDPVISLLEVEVDGTQMRWRLDHCAGAKRDRLAADKVELLLGDRRRTTITMLSDLLHHAEDGRRRDALSKDLYRDLLRVVGHELFDLLFVGQQLRHRMANELNLLRDQEVCLFRITLTFEGHHEEWLSSLPWEYACTPIGDPDFPRQGVFLAQRAELVLSRRLRVSGARRLASAAWPVSVLLVSSSPKTDQNDSKQGDLTPVDPTHIVEKLTKLEEQDLIELTMLVEQPPEHPSADYQWRVTREAVSEEVARTDPVIVHFMGHGRSFDGAGHLAFAHDDGTVDWVNDSDFARLVERSPRFKLGFLQACESALPDPYVSFSGVARHLAGEGLPAVVAMQYQVRSATANAFAGAFYDALLTERLPIDHAVEKGRKCILDDKDANERLAFGLPVVYLNSHDGLTDPDATPPNQHRTPALRRNDIDATIVCPRCRLELSSTAKVCRKCGLRVRCEACERPFPEPESDRYCECGERLNQTPFGEDTVGRAPGSVMGEATKPALATLTALRGEEGT